ncbi:MAG: SLC13 family permease [Chloroflexi bacterium]|nr:SLC13 family permease [Chloroflexota bacterium]
MHSQPASSTKTSRSDRRAAIQTATAVGVFLLLLLAPLPGNLPPQGQRVLAVVGLAVVLWVTELVPNAVTGLLAVVLLALTGGAKDVNAAISGFASPTSYFLIGILGLGLGVTRSGLAGRVARWATSWAKGSPRLLYWQMLLSYVPMTLLLPSATTRSSIQIPVYDRVLDQWGVAQTHPFGKAVTQSLGSLNRLASTALLTGGTSPVVAAGLLGGIGWGRWFLLLALPYYAMMVIGGVALYLWYRKGFSVVPQQAAQAEVRPWTGAELRATAIALLTAGLWFTDSLHHLHPAVPALLALVLMLLPKVGVLTWRELERDMSWSTFVTLATSLSLANAMVESGVAAWMAGGMKAVAGPVTSSPIGVLIALTLVCLGIRLFIPSIVGYLAFVIPVAVSLAHALGYNPLPYGLAALIIGDSVVFYPAAGTSGVLVYARGNVTGIEVFRLALLMAVMAFLILLAIAVPWWALMGEPLRP